MTIELSTYADFISKREVMLVDGKIDKDGTFELDANLHSTTFAYLKIGIQKNGILLEPGRIYDLKIRGILDESLRNQEIAPFQIPALEIYVLKPWNFELNSLVQDFFNFHDSFLAEHSMALVRQRDASLVQQYISEVYNLFPGIDNAWFNDMLTCKIASVEMMARAKSQESIARQYLLVQEILYDHIFYMDFFNQFFDKYLITSRVFGRNILLGIMESEQAYDVMMELLERDPILEDRQLRELVLIRNMPDILVTPGFRQQRIIQLLEEILTKSSYPEHKEIARNLIARMS